MADRKEWKEQLLSKLLDQYEKSVTYAGENKVKQVFSVKPSDIFKGYNKDFLPPEQLFQKKEFERLIRQMESEGLIHVVPPNTGILRQICAVPERWEDYYACLNRTEKNILKKRLEEVYHRFCQCDLLEAYGKEKLQTLKNSRARKLDEKKVEKEITEAEAIWNLVQFLKENREKQRTTLEREMSEAVLHDSKQWEKIYRKKVCGILEHTGRYDEPLAELEEERERQTALLEEFYIYSNPAYIYLKGDARICLEDGRELRIYHDLPMSIPFETFQKAKSIQIQDVALMTVENLTSFHRLEREHIFYLFLSGYHTRTKQALLQRIARENPGLSWHHFGDLDPDGLAIAGHLIRKTGLPFQLCAMGVQELQRFQTYAKPLEAPDRAKAEAMIKQGSSYAGILRYMLEHNCKLEQEIISWQETRLESFL
ncbi:Wadjet anti-phage system protein JetD domain-containing protein [uncultured Clostridium sp.]|uniref:Wadjet anti-phage system protein JetD domain-containing protein n=1 Tax=uncultured Clostridium sp. TaxID=59620 RepID=UPI00266D1A63|nr:Wadjet anti-phage system protein JetD domain-containing protein [uncultured Clostridium sp.]